MSAKTETTSAGALDAVKLILATAILLGGIVGYYYYEDASVFLRAAGMVLALAAALGVFFTTVQGKTLWKFIQGSRVELRKVVWPTRQETMQTTLMVIFFVVLMAVFFFLLDKVLFWATGLLTGQGG
jgi:preprotein translocase subunit SecE